MVSAVHEDDHVSTIRLGVKHTSLVTDMLRTIVGAAAEMGSVLQFAVRLTICTRTERDDWLLRAIGSY